LTEELAEALRTAGFEECWYYHSMSDGKNNATERWLKNDSFITATETLETGVDFLRVVYIVHLEVLYRLIDFVQESGHGEKNKETVNLIILLDNKEYKKLEKTDTVVMTMDKFFIYQFIQSTEYW
jgi:superfamily II DNA helicase RecQ